MRRALSRNRGRVWSLPAAVLALGLLGTGLWAEEDESSPPQEGAKTTVIGVSGDRTVTNNEDGSKTANATVTTTNTATGTVRTAASEVTVQKTDTGRSWTRDTAVSGSNGFNLNSTTTGASTNNGDGSGWWNSLTQGTVSGPKGNSVDYTTERSGSWSANDQGGRDFSSTATTTTSNGGTSTVNRNLSTYQVSDGVKGFTGESNRTFGNGATVDRTIDGTVTKTETGRSWDSTVTGTATGPNGNTHSWTADLDGSTTRNADGSISIDSSKTITGDKGGTTTIEKEGSFTKGADGTWHYEGSKDVSHTPPTAAPVAPSAAAKQPATQNAAAPKAATPTVATEAARKAPATGLATNGETDGAWNNWKSKAAQTSGGVSSSEKWAKWRENVAAGQTGQNAGAGKWAEWKDKASQNQQAGGLKGLGEGHLDRDRGNHRTGAGAGSAGAGAGRARRTRR